jgi:hypothetical protein
MGATIKTISHPDGKRRVLIERLDNGSFTFTEEKYWDDPLEHSWLPAGRSNSLCDSAETAEREARGRITWLSELS